MNPQRPRPPATPVTTRGPRTDSVPSHSQRHSGPPSSAPRASARGLQGEPRPGSGPSNPQVGRPRHAHTYPGCGPRSSALGLGLGSGPRQRRSARHIRGRPEEAAVRLLRRAGRDARRALAAARWRDVCGAGGAEAVGRARPARRERGLMGWRRSGPCFVESGGCYEGAA